MDRFSHGSYLESQRTKADDSVAASLCGVWKGHGDPGLCQFRQTAELPGSNRLIPASFGIVIRLLLY